MAPGDELGPARPGDEAGSGADPAETPEFYLDLAERLRDAHRRANALPESVRIPVIRRLLTVTEAVKRDPVRASRRLDRMLEELPPQVDEPPTR
ncbi:hypothetical protein GCM10009799_36450 [Nocardiopsis rhodophaea]|uniref:Uncharacterized protein n=1 Tax=Nocardiopsis rhodophaea TaxID=280238 RepID=A0ABN2TE13_9ACTN